MRVRCIGPLEYISDTHADTVPFVLHTRFLPLRPALRNPVKNMANDELSHRIPFDGSSNSAMPASLPHTQVPSKTLAEISARHFFSPKIRNARRHPVPSNIIGRPPPERRRIDLSCRVLTSARRPRAIPPDMVLETSLASAVVTNEQACSWRVGPVFPSL